MNEWWNITVICVVEILRNSAKENDMWDAITRMHSTRVRLLFEALIILIKIFYGEFSREQFIDGNNNNKKTKQEELLLTRGVERKWDRQKMMVGKKKHSIVREL